MRGTNLIEKGKGADSSVAFTFVAVVASSLGISEEDEDEEDDEAGAEGAEEDRLGGFQRDQFECSRCGRRFSRRDNRDRHFQLECGQAPQFQRGQFKCSRCGQRYSRRDNRDRHYRLECGQKPKFQCPVCRLTFTRKNNVVRHVSRKHGTVFA